MALLHQPAVLQVAAPAATTKPAWHLPAALWVLMHQTIMGLWAPNMRVGHRNALAHFEHFCNAYLMPRGKRYPISEAVLCAFAVHRAGRVAGLTVCNDIAGLHAYHIAHALPWPMPLHLKYIITGIERACPEASWRTLRPPASLPLLCAVY
jgi:hypothetical protein